MKINQLTSAEEQLMQILWRIESGYLKDIIESYPDPKPHQNTVSTFLKILVQKEYLTTEKEGRIFRYCVAVPRDYFRSFLLRNLLEEYFENSAEQLLQTLINEKLISENTVGEVSVKASAQNRKDKKQEEAESVAHFVKEITSEKKEEKKKKAKKKNKRKES